MRLSIALLACLCAVIGAGAPCAAQTKPPEETRNAATAYWQAITKIPDPLPDSLIGGPVVQTEAGTQAWDEAKLGPILDANKAAILEMQRATKLPECDWTTEKGRDEYAFVPYSMRARALARLNTLYGMQLMAKGDSQGALESWLDGAKFARDIGKGGPVILQLIGHAALLPDLKAMTAAASAGRFSPQQKAQIAAAFVALPPDVFDWSAAYGLEETAGERFWNQVCAAKHPAAAYQEISGTKMPSKMKCPSEAEVQEFRTLTEKAQASLQRPPADAEPSLQRLQQQIGRSQLSLSVTVPLLMPINKARSEVVMGRDALLKAVGA